MNGFRLFSYGAGLVLAVLGGTQALAADWPNYRGPSHDGVSAESLAPWGSASPRPLWKVKTHRGFSSFSVANGRAFTLVTREVDGVNRETLLALDASSGKELWASPVAVSKYDGGGDSGTKDNGGGDGPRSTPVVNGDHVYVISVDVTVACLEAATGKMVWSRNLLKEHDGKNISWQNAASPLIVGDLLFAAGGGKGQALLGLRKSDGSVAWKGEDDAMTHATPIPARIHGVDQVLFYTQSGLVSVVPESGKVLWRQAYRFAVSTAASPVVYGDVVYCSAGYGVGAGAYKVSKAGDVWSVAELWRETGNKLANHWSTPVVKDGYLYGMFQFKEYGSGPLKCVEIATGKEVWSKAGFGPGNVLLVAGKLLVLGDAGQLVLANASPAGYQELAQFDALEGKCWSTPALANGRAYVRSTAEGACFDLSAKVSQR